MRLGGDQFLLSQWQPVDEGLDGGLAFATAALVRPVFVVARDPRIEVGQPTPLSISKRGDGYLRMLMIHGARSVLLHAAARAQADQVWHVQVMQRCNRNIAGIALANNSARTM